VPDLGTLRLASWLDKTALVLCDVRSEKTHDLVGVAPALHLRQQSTPQAHWDTAASPPPSSSTTSSARATVTPLAGLSRSRAGRLYLEDYHILQGTRTESFHAAAPPPPQAFGVPVEDLERRMGARPARVNVRYAGALEMADRHVVFKQCLKELAEAAGMSLTFMAKFAADRAGSSCHNPFQPVARRQNAFAGDRAARRTRVFEVFAGSWRWDRARARCDGVLRSTINSYKRYVDASWAPTRLAWSYDNRTAGFRVVGTGRACASNAASPAPTAILLALAASLASGLEGIAARLEPPECFVGDVYAAKNLPRVPLGSAKPSSGRQERIRAARLWQRGSRALLAFLPHRGSGLRHGGHRLGTQAILRKNMRLQDKVALITGAAAASAGRRRCSSPRRARRSWWSTSMNRRRERPPH